MARTNKRKSKPAEIAYFSIVWLEYNKVWKDGRRYGWKTNG